MFNYFYSWVPFSWDNNGIELIKIRRIIVYAHPPIVNIIVNLKVNTTTIIIVCKCCNIALDVSNLVANVKSKNVLLSTFVLIITNRRMKGIILCDFVKKYFFYILKDFNFFCFVISVLLKFR